MSEALARVGAALDKWAAEQRLRSWARSLAAAEDSPDRVTGPLLGGNVEDR
jgi:hypothetical protein